MNISSFINKGNARSVQAKKNIAASFAIKGLNILISLQVVPITINYINPTRYGIWLTLSSIIAWLSYFDLGFAHGFRNRFAEAKAKGDYRLAKQYVSTTYFALGVLFVLFFSIVFITNFYISWSLILHISEIYDSELRMVFGVLAFFFCTKFIAGVFTTMLDADQRPALRSLIDTSGQVLGFICICILTKTIKGNLSILAFVFAGIPCIWLVIVSFFMFRTKKYKKYAPSLKEIRLNLIRNIVGMGSQFFVIMISMLLIFQVINIIISRIEGPEAVTQYNIAYKYFNVLNMFFTIIITPFWSAFTDAYTKKDFVWMKNVQKKLEYLWLLCIPIMLLMLLCSDWLYKWWIGDSVHIPFILSLSIGFYMLSMTLGSVYMYLINGTGKVRIQLIIYTCFAVVSIPLLNYTCKLLGITGVLIVPALVFLFQALIGRIQIKKIIAEKALGIWDK